MHHPRVTLVGAGPGDPELLTLKGDRALRGADVVLYDALVNTDMLGMCKRSCRKVYVGKRKGHAPLSQQAINALIAWHARRYPHVVRLKGGDPYIFGRGQEEADYLVKAGIEVDVVPGISSALSAPALAGISVTQRGVNESFWVITGTLSDGTLSGDLEHAAQSTATIIVLMGVSKLREIARLVCRYRTALEPMAIIQDASLPTQREVFSTASTIVCDALTADIGSPAVIVIGRVAAPQHLSLIRQEVLIQVHAQKS